MDIRKTIIDNILNDAKASAIHVAIFSIFFNIILFSSPIYMLQIYNRILPARSEETLVWLTALVILLFVTMAAIDAARHMMFVRLAGKFDNQVTRHLLSLTLTEHARSSEPDRSSVLLEIDQIRALLSKGHLLHLFDLMWLPFFIVAIALFHPILAVVAVVGAIAMVLIALANHIFVGPSTEEARNAAVWTLNQADQMLKKADLIQSLGMKSTMIQRWSVGRDTAVSSHMKASDRQSVVAAISKALRMLIQTTMLGVGAYLAIHNFISPGAIVAASILVGRTVAPIEASILAWQELLKTRTALGRLLHVFEKQDASTNPMPLLACRGKLEVEDLSCSIDGLNIIRDINFEMEPGEMVAIIGPNGCGKTTLVRHLVGSWHGSAGIVRLDDLDVATLSDEARCRYLGYVPQETQLLEGSIVETISRFGTPEPEDIVETAQLAGIHKMVLRLPNGYGTRIGVDGCRLSGGQRQRLALARALYGSPPYVVLDEPCAHLDEIGESALLQTMEELKNRRTTICLVTHKTNFIRLADHLLILNDRGEARFGSPSVLFRPKLKAVPRRRAVTP